MKTENRAKVRKALVFAIVLDIAIAAAVVLKNLNSSSRTFEAKIFRSIADRAQVNLFEDFRGGLDAWESSQPLTRTWSYDPSGLVSPGQLAFFKPSKQLENYEVETGAEVIKGFRLIFRAGIVKLRQTSTIFRARSANARTANQQVSSCPGP